MFCGVICDIYSHRFYYILRSCISVPLRILDGHKFLHKFNICATLTYRTYEYIILLFLKIRMISTFPNYKISIKTGTNFSESKNFIAKDSTLHYPVHKNPPFFSILNHIKPLRLSLLSFKIYFVL